MAQQTIDAFALSAELDGAGQTLECIRNLLKDRGEGVSRYDQPPMNAVCESLYSIQKQIFRISEDLSQADAFKRKLESVGGDPEREADQDKPLSFAQMLGEDANSAGDKG